MISLIEEKNSQEPERVSIDLLAEIAICIVKKISQKSFRNGFREGQRVPDPFRKVREQAAYDRGYEDGYDEACMDLTDDDLGSAMDEEDAAATDCPWT